ncbi:Por secretion system C-terminal sorting domain-containing protein [Saccharicrinis carchari]|uniref:Por secretion system C-terminal sorting domain-containing protein n=1 Tax=Saccharicrinis carchari TaxID=1168039 RepID=A0A521DU70_SACCC|nr:T9SS type A sorting domain-containing protein [Saccharicrinis carchari]SMO75185.1 Por secretion system C-terminal sorting domain-containing protein [Saccharicrinis carchari]
MKKKTLLLFLLPFLLFVATTAQNYNLVWEENFDGTSLNTDVWTYDTPTGIWNWGSNQELQYYSPDNVSVGPDGEGNNALIITAKREAREGYQFTSGRIHTRGKVGVRYGKIEARIKLPVLADGLWPAFWTLGTKNVWPASGEIDILEGGHADGIAAGTQERSFNGAVHWQHAGNYAGHGPQYTAPQGSSLYQYNTFTMEWSPSKIEMFFNNETVPYFAMNIDGADAEEFRDWTHYFILNLAVGGSFPGITNPDHITAPLPAQMMVDYIKVYQKTGEGEVVITPPEAPPTADQFGIYTENPAITERFVIDDLNNSLQIWENSLQPLNDAPSYDGTEAMAFYALASRTWFGLGINANNGIDLSHYDNGYLKFALRTTADNNFWIGVGDQDGNEGKVEFNNGADPYGFQRDGQWHNISIPVSTLKIAGLNLSKASNIFMIGGEGAVSNILIDDIYYSTSPDDVSNSALNPNRNATIELIENKIVADYYGVYTENPNVTEKLLIDDVTGHIYSWENTLVGYPTAPYDGEESLAWRTTSDRGWFGFGIHDDIAPDLTHFANGTLSFSAKTSSQENFVVAIEGKSGSKGEIHFTVGNDPAGFLRDGEWHRVIVPIADLNVDLSAVPLPFFVTQGTGSSTISGFAFDDIIYTAGATQPENPNLYTGGIDIGESTHPLWDSWFGDGGNGSVTYFENHLATVSVNEAGWASYSVQLFQDNMNLPNATYTLTFRAKADAPRSINVNVGKGLNVDPWFDPFMDGVTFDITTEWQTYTHTFTKTNPEPMGKLVFELGTATNGTAVTNVHFDDVVLAESNATNINKRIEKSFAIYPNPAKDVVYVIAEPGSVINLYNMTGKLVATQLASETKNTIDVSALPKGLYLIKTDENIEKLIIK